MRHTGQLSFSLSHFSIQPLSKPWPQGNSTPSPFLSSFMHMMQSPSFLLQGRLSMYSWLHPWGYSSSGWPGCLKKKVNCGMAVGNIDCPKRPPALLPKRLSIPSNGLLGAISSKLTILWATFTGLPLIIVVILCTLALGIWCWAAAGAGAAAWEALGEAGLICSLANWGCTCGGLLFSSAGMTIREAVLVSSTKTDWHRSQVTSSAGILFSP